MSARRGALQHSRMGVTQPLPLAMRHNKKEGSLLDIHTYVSSHSLRGFFHPWVYWNESGLLHRTSSGSMSITHGSARVHRCRHTRYKERPDISYQIYDIARYGR